MPTTGNQWGLEQLLLSKVPKLQVTLPPLLQKPSDSVPLRMALPSVPSPTKPNINRLRQSGWVTGSCTCKDQHGLQAQSYQSSSSVSPKSLSSAFCQVGFIFRQKALINVRCLPAPTERRASLFKWGDESRALSTEPWSKSLELNSWDLLGVLPEPVILVARPHLPAKLKPKP